MKRLKDAKKEILEEEMRLSEPQIDDLERVYEVFNLCVEAYMEAYPDTKNLKREGYKQILFVLLFIFSPKTLSGSKMREGLRDKLSTNLKISPQSISHSIANLMFFYTVYKDFRYDVNYIFTYVFEKLREKQP